MPEVFYLLGVLCLACAAYISVWLALDAWAPYIEQRGRNKERFRYRLFLIINGYKPLPYFTTDGKRYYPPPPINETHWGASI